MRSAKPDSNIDILVVMTLKTRANLIWMTYIMAYF